MPDPFHDHGHDIDRIVSELIQEAVRPVAISVPIVEDGSLLDLGIDSMGVLSLLALCEKRFDLDATSRSRFPDLDTVKTVKDVKNFVEKILAT